MIANTRGSFGFAIKIAPFLCFLLCFPVIHDNPEILCLQIFISPPIFSSSALMYDIMSVESIFFDGECIEMAYRILFDSGREADLFGSKLGGLPYWDFSGDLEYPVGADGKRMQLLFQINFDEDSE
ncbi:MAG: DUF1963 domain-containing protein, partial [Treponema sp.]|nr:DUF1963 domain-containing protein [Treponema sp.]